MAKPHTLFKRIIILVVILTMTSSQLVCPIENQIAAISLPDHLSFVDTQPLANQYARVELRNLLKNGKHAPEPLKIRSIATRSLHSGLRISENQLPPKTYLVWLLSISVALGVLSTEQFAQAQSQLTQILAQTPAQPSGSLNAPRKNVLDQVEPFDLFDPESALHPLNPFFLDNLNNTIALASGLSIDQQPLLLRYQLIATRLLVNHYENIGLFDPETLARIEQKKSINQMLSREEESIWVTYQNLQAIVPALRDYWEKQKPFSASYHLAPEMKSLNPYDEDEDNWEIFGAIVQGYWHGDPTLTEQLAAAIRLAIRHDVIPSTPTNMAVYHHALAFLVRTAVDPAGSMLNRVLAKATLNQVTRQNNISDLADKLYQYKIYLSENDKEDYGRIKKGVLKSDTIELLNHLQNDLTQIALSKTQPVLVQLIAAQSLVSAQNLSADLRVHLKHLAIQAAQVSERVATLNILLQDQATTEWALATLEDLFNERGLDTPDKITIASLLLPFSSEVKPYLLSTINSTQPLTVRAQAASVLFLAEPTNETARTFLESLLRLPAIDAKGQVIFNGDISSIFDALDGNLIDEGARHALQDLLDHLYAKGDFDNDKNNLVRYAKVHAQFQMDRLQQDILEQIDTTIQNDPQRKIHAWTEIARFSVDGQTPAISIFVIENYLTELFREKSEWVYNDRNALHALAERHPDNQIRAQARRRLFALNFGIYTTYTVYVTGIAALVGLVLMTAVRSIKRFLKKWKTYRQLKQQLEKLLGPEFQLLLHNPKGGGDIQQQSTLDELFHFGKRTAEEDLVFTFSIKYNQLLVSLRDIAPQIVDLQIKNRVLNFLLGELETASKTFFDLDQRLKELDTTDENDAMDMTRALRRKRRSLLQEQVGLYHQIGYLLGAVLAFKGTVNTPAANRRALLIRTLQADRRFTDPRFQEMFFGRKRSELRLQLNTRRKVPYPIYEAAREPGSVSSASNGAAFKTLASSHPIARSIIQTVMTESVKHTVSAGENDELGSFDDWIETYQENPVNQTLGLVITPNFVSEFAPFLPAIALSTKHSLVVVAPKALGYLRTAIESANQNLPVNQQIIAVENYKEAYEYLRSQSVEQIQALGSNADFFLAEFLVANRVLSSEKDLVIIRSVNQLRQLFDFISDELIQQYESARQLAIAA